MQLPYFTHDEIRLALPFPELVKQLKLAFQQAIQSPRRHAHQIQTAPLCNLLLMPVWQEQARLGVKLVTVAPQNQGLPSVHAIFLLFDAATGAPLAIMDGEELTKRRTAAASVLAANYLARVDASHLLLVGNGALSPYMAAAYATCRRLQKITIWGRNSEKSQACLAQLRQMSNLPASLELKVSSDLAEACGEADIICCATTSTQALLDARWIKPGCHLDLVGGFKPDMREASDELMQNSCVFVDTFSGAMAEAGDIVQPLQRGLIDEAHVLAELADLCSGRHSGRQRASDITLFKSVGTAIEDLVAAELVWQARPAA